MVYKPSRTTSSSMAAMLLLLRYCSWAVAILSVARGALVVPIVGRVFVGRSALSRPLQMLRSHGYVHGKVSDGVGSCR